MQLLASWRTELTRRVGIDELVPVSRVAVAPAPVAPAVPVAPVVAPVEGRAGLEVDDVERVARTSTLLLTVLPQVVLIPALELIGRSGFPIWRRRRIGQYVERARYSGRRRLGSAASRVAGPIDSSEAPGHFDFVLRSPFFGAYPGRLRGLRADACGKRCR